MKYIREPKNKKEKEKKFIDFVYYALDESGIYNGSEEIMPYVTELKCEIKKLRETIKKYFNFDCIKYK